MTTLLLIEDNPHIMKINTDTLRERGYTVYQGGTLKIASEIVEKNKIDLIVLDILLPDGNGVEFCKELRRHKDIPIIFLSAKNQDIDIVDGLRCGADDYLTKPYSLEVLVARIENLLRRTRDYKKRTQLKFSFLQLDTLAMRAYINREDLLLTQKEFAILLLLAQNMGKIVGRDVIYNNVWKQEGGRDNRILWTTVSRLKKKLESHSKYIKLVTLRSTGYKLEILKD